MLIILSGLPDTGKTALARELASQIGAIHLRIDSIEHAIRDSGVLTGSIDDAGYRVACAIAEDNLKLGRAGPAMNLEGQSAGRRASLGSVVTRLSWWCDAR